MFGSEYLIQHVVSEYNRNAKDKAYRYYVADMLKCISESWGNKVYYSLKDLCEPHNEEEKTGDEIALEVIRKIGLKGKDSERT